MTRSLLTAMTLPVALTFLFLPGCADESPNEIGPGAADASGKEAPGSGPGSAARSNPKIKEIMAKIGKGPHALQGSLGDALKQAEPAWDTIQPKTQEYALLTSEMGKLEPVKGNKDSWAKLTSAFAESAAELEHAAQAKDKDKTREALDSLGGSCMACHRSHRVMGPGRSRHGSSAWWPRRSSARWPWRSSPWQAHTRILAVLLPSDQIRSGAWAGDY